MITDDMIKKEFISRTVSRDINLIYKTQEQVVRETFPNGTGTLANALVYAPFSEIVSELNITFHMRIFPYLRFLDIKYRRGEQMKLRRKLALYNRVVWGVLYNETLPDLRTGFTEDIKKSIGQELRGAFEK